MSITHVQMENLRNLKDVSFNPHEKYNFFIGPNGSGKTSLLEGVHLLGTARSFRTKNNRKLIGYAHQALFLKAKIEDLHTVGLHKEETGLTSIKINQKIQRSNTELARLLPLQLYSQDAFKLIDASPKIRRNILDWGVFHVEPLYFKCWHQYQKALKQRNCLLRTSQAKQGVAPWDHLLCQSAEEIHAMRQRYMAQWLPLFFETFSELSDLEIDIQYYKGWGQSGEAVSSLEACLHKDWEQDLRRQYTRSGPHQADLILTSGKKHVKEFFSRGQQKLILVAIKIAQGVFLSRLKNKDCVFLFDDLASEFDSDNVIRIAQYLNKIPGQYFFTCVNEEEIALLQGHLSGQVFQVNEGRVGVL